MNNFCQVGDVVKLKFGCLSNPIGTLGVCYETYEIGNREGAAFIFENGYYDGFAPDEQEKFLELMWNDATLSLCQLPRSKEARLVNEIHPRLVG